jgi:hypothetical protein
LTWPEIVEEALRRLIDSIRRSVPGDGWVIRLTPRRKRSIWPVSVAVRRRAAGRMRPAGRPRSRRAKPTGRRLLVRAGTRS